MRIHNSIRTVTLGILTAVAAIPKEPAAQSWPVDKHRRCDLQVRMFDGYCFVSMIDLIANPELFDGKKVMVQGYAHFEFEGDAIYLHKEDFLYGNLRNSLWIEIDHTKSFGKCQDSYAYVRGTYRASVGGHFDMFSGVLHDIFDCRAVQKLHD